MWLTAKYDYDINDNFVILDTHIHEHGLTEVIQEVVRAMKIGECSCVP
jgi:hypothetical protein